MARPVIGIISNEHVISEGYHIQGSGIINIRAASCVANGLPLMVPSDPEFVDVPSLLEACDGFIFTGGRPNVHPKFYGEQETEAHGAFDQCRDQLVLDLIRQAVDMGQPILGICRGFQEMNVAFGGSLYPEIRDLPGRMNHRMPPDGTIEEKFALRHEIALTEGGVFAGIFGTDKVRVNSLHGQGIKQPGARIEIEGYAPDGTPEAIFVRDAPGFALAVQWHPEWNAEHDAVSRPLFRCFGEAARAWHASRSPSAMLKSA